MTKHHHNKFQLNTQVKTQDLKLEKRIHFSSIDSTNTWAKQQVDQWAANGITLITAAEQTAGRGRFKRSWESPPDVNIYATFCFWMSAQRTDSGQIPQLLALAAAQTLEQLEFKPTLKWPNDILLREKKVGGILCETVSEKEQRGIVCGIGLNVNMPAEALNRIDRPATSLFVEKQQLFDPAALLEMLQARFVEDLNQFLKEGFAPFFPCFQYYLAFKKGEKIRFHDNQTLLEAQFEEVRLDGSVVLRLRDGILKIFHAGEFVS